MAWWITFTLVATLIMALGFGSGGVVAGMRWNLLCPLACRHLALYVAYTSFRPRFSRRRPFIVHVRSLYARWRHLRNVDEYGYAGGTDVARCYYCGTPSHRGCGGRDGLRCGK